MKEENLIEKAIIDKAITFILSHLEEDIGVEDVSSFCNVSKFHLTRLFKEETGEAIYEYILRSKIERSAWRLKVEKDKSVTEIGSDYGYSSSNYATVFKKKLSLSPSSFRRNSEILVKESSFSQGLTLDDLDNGDITIEYLDPFFVLYERKKGNYNNLSSSWCSFIDKYYHLRDENTKYIECTLDDPTITDEDSCMYQLCQTIDRNDPRIKQERLFTTTFDGGKYAVYHFKGWPKSMFLVYQEMVCRWLKKTGNELDSKPIFDIYSLVREDGYMEIDICFPLK